MVSTQTTASLSCSPQVVSILSRDHLYNDPSLRQTGFFSQASFVSHGCYDHLPTGLPYWPIVSQHYTPPPQNELPVAIISLHKFLITPVFNPWLPCHPVLSHHSVSSHVILPLPSSRRSCVRPSSLSPYLGWPEHCSAGLSAPSYAIYYPGFFPYVIFTAALSTPALTGPRFRISLDPAGPRICVTWCLPVLCPAPGQSL